MVAGTALTSLWRLIRWQRICKCWDVIFISSPFSSLSLDFCRHRVGEIQSSALTLGTCWTASQSMMLALTCLLFRWFKSCNNPYFQYQNQSKPFSSYLDCELSRHPWRHQSTFPVLVTTGTLFNLISSLMSSWNQVPKNYEKCPFYFWFHTAFVKDNSLILTRYPNRHQTLCFPLWSWWRMHHDGLREELDNPHKPKTWDVFRESLKVELRQGCLFVQKT